MLQKYPFRPNPALYEINTAAWLFDLSRRAGRQILLGNVPAAEWDRIKARGMDFVWLMGVWNRSQESRKISLTSAEFRAMFEQVLPGCSDADIIGSCYSISSYDPDPLIGTWEDIDRARAELHRRGMGLVLDFVPNHTGVDHPWLQEHPEYYIQVDEETYRKDIASYFPVPIEDQTLFIAHGRDPNFPAWTDTAQLNYFNPATRDAMVRCIQEIARHCDSIRCDMAMLELNSIFQGIWGCANRESQYRMPEEEFWIQAVHAAPELVFMAEAYWDTEYTLQQLGFDFVYDKRLYDRLLHSTPEDVRGHLKADIEYQKKLVRFIENHDEPRSAAAFGRDRVKAAAALVCGLPGMKLYFHGQFEGKQVRLPIQLRQSRPDPADPDIQAFYNRLLPLVSDEIFHSGSWRLKTVFPDGDSIADSLIAYGWKYGNALRLVMVNLSSQPASGRVDFQDDVDEMRDYVLTDLLSGESQAYNGKLMAHPGLILKMGAYQARIYSADLAVRSAKGKNTR